MSLRDIPVWLYLVTGFALVVVIGTFISYEMIAELLQVPIAKQYAGTYLNEIQGALLLFDYATLFAFVSMFAATTYLASRIPASPAYMGVSLVIGLFMIYMSGQVANILIAIIETSPLQGFMSKLPLTATFVRYLPYAVTAGVFVLNAVMYKTGRTGRAQSL